MRKEPQRSLPQHGKEPVIHRIFKLVELYPTKSEAANAWGINISTLQNYYKRVDLSPIPRTSQLKKIAEHEGVSMEWLLSGEGPNEQKKNRK